MLPFFLTYQLIINTRRHLSLGVMPLVPSFSLDMLDYCFYELWVGEDACFTHYFINIIPLYFSYKRLPISS